MTAKEIREAAKRVIAPPYDYGRPTREYTTDAINVAEYILANVQEDGEERITDEWLSSVGGELFEYENDFGRCYCFHMDNDVVLNMELPSRAYLWDVGNDHIICELEQITTCSQFRALMVGLGIDKPSK